MTYEELYRKVEGLWHDSFKSTPWMIIWYIVKLHKMNKDQDCFDCSNKCIACGEYYPCATIQTIEKELE